MVSLFALRWAFAGAEGANPVEKMGPSADARHKTEHDGVNVET
jgi:hypothetical protein